MGCPVQVWGGFASPTKNRGSGGQRPPAKIRGEIDFFRKFLEKNITFLKAMSNEKFSKNPKKRKFSISLGTLMILPSLLVPIIFLITDYIQLKFTGVHVWELVRFWESDRTLCNKKLTDDQNEAKLIYGAERLL
mgnify:CR=1 FL=1